MKIKKEFAKNIFREYDIRGEYKSELDEDTAYTIGLTFGTMIKRDGKTQCVVGHDNRLSADALTEALIKGIISTGINVKYIGLVTTPMHSFACLHFGIDSGIMVTASHNPVNDNGFKIMLKNYDCACGEYIKDIYNAAISGEFASGQGTVEEIDIKKEYLNSILSDVRINKKLKVVFDPANASGTVVLKDICDNIGIEPIYINNVSDGSFPSHHPDPSVPENLSQLREKVLETNADCGISYDGDADRVGIVDEKGEIISIDTFMAIIWDDIIDKVDNKTAIFDVKCSKQLEDEVIRIGGTPFLYRTGAAYIRNKVKEMNFSFGGELAGHVFFRDRWYGFDDGIYAGIRFLEILSKCTKKASELDDHMNKYFSTPEIKVATSDDKKFKIVEEVKKYVQEKGYSAITVDGVRVTFSDGWALVRASNTGPNMTTRYEASSEERLEEIKKEFSQLINKLNL